MGAKPITPASTFKERTDEVVRFANEKFLSAESWIEFFRSVLGVDGIVHTLFPSPDELDSFERLQVYADLQQKVAKLREKRQTAEPNEPTRVITVRLPKSLHEALRRESHSRQTSMNKLCISKLLQTIDPLLVPLD